MNERRYFSPEEKMKIVLEGLNGTIQMSDLCKKYDIKAARFYSWKEKMLKNSAAIFDDRGRKRTRSDDIVEIQKEEIAKLKDTIAEITTENLQLKKKICSYGVKR